MTPTNPFHRAVLSAWLRRVCMVPMDPNYEDYHPGKANKIYLRFRQIIDRYV